MATKKNKTPSKVESGEVSSDSILLKKGKLGRYEIKKKLGAGGMGAVYLAIDPQLNRLVALKILPRDKAENPTLVKRFKAEAQAAAQLTHDHIVRIYGSGEEEGYHYIALEYVEGTDVHRLVRKRGRLPIRRSTEIIKQVAVALEHASEAGIVHRDIKPANLLITQSGVVKLTDLGLARALDDEETSITRDGTTVGTVDYMSPEQGRSSKAADIRSDLYSLGCTWYHMLTGQPPYPEGGITNKLHAHATATIPDPRSINESIPETIAGVVSRLMAKKPVDRYQSVQELLDDLDAVKNSRKEISASDLAALSSSEEIDEDEQDSGKGTATSRSQKSRRVGSSSSAAEAKKTKAKSSEEESIPPRERKKLSELEEGKGEGFNWAPVAYLGGAVALIAIIGMIGVVMSGLGKAIEGDSTQSVDLADLTERRQKERQEEIDKIKQEQEGSKTNPNHNQVNRQYQEPKPEHPLTPNSTGNPNLNTNPTDVPGGKETETAQVIQIISLNKKTDASSAHSLNEAIEKVTKPNVVIEVQGKGLTIWDQSASIDIKGVNLTLRAGKKSSGLILIRSSGALFDGFLTVQKGTLKIQGLHFGLLGFDLPGNKKLTLLRTTDTDLEVDNCSFTMEENRQSPVLLYQASWTGNRVGKSNWKNCLIRGTGWQPFSFAGRKIRSTLQNSVVAIGAEPVYAIRHESRSGVQDSFSASSDPEKSQRDLSVKDSIIVCQGKAIVLDNPSGEANVPSTLIRLNRSSFVAGGEAEAQPFLTVKRWPENILSAEGEGKLARLNWLSENSVVAGWSKRLLATTSKTRSTFKADTTQQWESIWGNSGLQGRWELKGVSPNATSHLSYLKPTDLTGHEITSQARVDPQVIENLVKISVPALSEETWRAEAALSSPPRSPFLDDPFAGDVNKLKVDLTKTDLGQFLASQNLEQKTIVEAKGFGLRYCSPVSIKNKQVKIQFISERGKPSLMLRPIPGKTGSVGKSVPWFTVKAGTLVLENGAFYLQSFNKKVMPSHLIEAEDSAIRLVKCYVTGPLKKHAQLSSVIHATHPSTSMKSGDGLLIERSYLQYGGDLLDVDLQSNPMRTQNSLFISQNHIFNIRCQQKKEPSQTQARFEISQCTLASGKSHFHFACPAPNAYQKPAVAGYVSDTVFVAPVLPIKKTGTISLVSSAEKPAELSSSLWWWGARNGFAPEVSGKLLGRPVDQVWNQFWGEGHVRSPLFGAEGVMLVKLKKAPKTPTPTSYVLFSKSKAMNWNKEGAPIGAPIDELEVSSLAPAEVPTKKTPTTTAPVF